MIRLFVFAALMFLLSGYTYIGNEITVNSDCITLRDIFPDGGLDDNVFCNLDYGQQKIVNKQMSATLIEKYGIKNAEPEEKVFRRSGVMLTEEKLKADIQKKLTEMYPDMEISVDKVRMGRDYYLPENMQYTLDVPPNRFGNISVTVDNGIKKYTYSVSMTAQKEIYIATSPIDKGEMVAAKSALVKTDLSRLRGLPVTDVTDYFARTPIATGRPITANIVDKKLEIPRGAQVSIYNKTDSKLITDSGKLLDDAYDGKIVRVENHDTGKIMQGEYKTARKVFVMLQESQTPPAK